METALLLVSCRGHEGEVTDLALSRDGTLLASSSTDSTVRCWSLEVGACTSTHTGVTNHSLQAPGPLQAQRTVRWVLTSDSGHPIAMHSA